MIYLASKKAIILSIWISLAFLGLSIFFHSIYQESRMNDSYSWIYEITIFLYLAVYLILFTNNFITKKINNHLLISALGTLLSSLLLIYVMISFLLEEQMVDFLDIIFISFFVFLNLMIVLIKDFSTLISKNATAISNDPKQ